MSKFESRVEDNMKKFKKGGFVNIRKGFNLATMQPSDRTKFTGLVDNNIRIYE